MTKSAKRKRKMRDQSDFGLLSHQVCLGAKQLEKKKQIGRSISQKRKAKKHYTSHSLPKDTKNHIPVIPKPSRQPYR
jgi:hypothetical protein